VEDHEKTRQQLLAELTEMQQRIAGLSTKLQRAEEALQALQGTFTKVERAKREWESAVDALPDLVCLIDEQGRLIRANRTVEAWNLGRVVEVNGRGLHELVHPKCANPACYLDSILKHVVEKAIHQPAQQEAFDPVLKRHILVRICPMLHRNGEAGWAAVVVMQDITERERVEEALKLDEARLTVLQQLNQMTDASSQKIMDFALEAATQLTGSDVGYLALLNDDETLLTMSAWSKSAMEECHVVDKPLAYSQEITGLWDEAVRQRKPVITNDYAAPNPWKKGDPEGHAPLTRHMNVPLSDGDRIVAVAGVGNKLSNYDESDVRQLELLMAGMWRIIQRQRAEEEVKRLNQDLERRAMELDALNQAGLAMTSTLNMESVLKRVMSEVKKLLDAEGASVLLRDPLSDDLIFAAVADPSPKELVGTRIPTTSGIAGWVMRERQATLVNNAQDDPRFSGAIDAETGLTTHSIIAVPLKFQGAVWGVVEAINKTSGVFTQRDTEMLKALARSAAIAIQNAQLYSSLQETNVQLKEARLARDQMIQNVSHELRTPLGVIYGYIEVLESDGLGSLTQEQQNAVQIMHRQGDRLRFMVDRLLALQAFDASSLQRLNLDLGPWLRRSMETWEGRAARAGIKLRTEISPTSLQLLADPVFLGQVMENLLDNAVKFSPRDSLIQVRAWRERDEAIVAVSDNGVGIPPDRLQKIFEYFYQVDGSMTRRFGGMGIGLSLCNVIVQAHGGRIWAESPGEGQGSTFYIALPLSPALG
jgi:signal transduction histidine kinase